VGTLAEAEQIDDEFVVFKGSIGQAWHRIKAISQKGRVNLANLTDEQPIEAEDDYRICVRHGRDEDTRPKERSVRFKPDDEHGDES
jgi:hypothetical protein